MDEAKRRSYGQACGIARFLDLLGERWALLVMRELLFGDRPGEPKRFGELDQRLPGISRNLLARRLRHLERAGLVRREGPTRVFGWRATEQGATLRPVLQVVGAWGLAHTHDPTRSPPASGSKA